MTDMRTVSGEPAPQRSPVVALLAANAVSAVGNAASNVALAWFVLQTTGSPALMGVAAAVVSIGGALSSALGGPLVDRVGLKRASVAGDALAAVAVALIPLLQLAGVLEFWHLLLLVLLMSTVNTQGDTARYALMPVLASRAAWSTERANAADRAIARLGQITGPLVAGALIAVMGPVNVLFVNAATYLASAVLIAVTVRATTGAGAPREARTGYRTELAEGLRFIRGHRLVLSLVLVAMVANTLDIPLFSVILPVYVQEAYGSAASLGVLLAAIAGGALLGTLAFAAGGGQLPRRLTFLVCLLAAPALFYTTLVAGPPLAVLVVVGALSGALTGPMTPLMLAVIQREVPPHLAGRVFGSLSAISGAAIPVGSIVVGIAVERVGVTATIAAMGVVYVAAALSMVPNRTLRGMDPDPAVPASRGSGA